MIGAGEQIGGYTIVQMLGRGGMGEVYLAQHRRVARRAAVKVLVPELSQNAVVLERFFNEAKAASLIRHPAIVEILDCDLYEGQAYIVMEFLDGESFGGYLTRSGPLERDVPFLLGVSLVVASAVGAAHATGIIHRDLKPDNIYLHLGANDGAVVVKILDFGIAKLALQDSGPSQTSTGVLLGTPTYMSPEQCRGAGRVDNRSDIYSLGCILYEAACGFPPFVREGMGDLIVAHVAETPVPPIQHVPSLPQALNDLILRMLEKNAEDRPQTMEEVVVALRDCAVKAGLNLDGPLHPRIPVERSSTSIESAVTQPPPLGPSGGDTASLRPRSRPVPIQDAVPVEVRPSSSRSARVSSPNRSAASRPVSGPTSNEFTGKTAPKSTTLSSTAAELALPPPAPRRNGLFIALAVGAVAVVGGGVALLRSHSNDGAPAAAVSGARPPAVVAEPPPVAPTPPAPAVAPAPKVVKPETVRIDFQGIPFGTTAQVDGAPASFPITLPRGPQVHQVVLSPPGQAARTVEINGTVDRIVDFVATAKAAAPEAHEKAAERESSRRPASGSHGKKSGKTSPGASDREAITDI